MAPLNLKNKGFSLIEVMITIAIIALIAIAAFLIYPRVEAGKKARNEASNIAIIQTNIRQIQPDRIGDYSALGGGKAGGVLDPGNANLARVYPSSMNNSNYTKNAPITSSWGGEVWVATRPANTTPMGPIQRNRSFGIFYEAVPTPVCNLLIPLLAGKFQSIWVGNTTELVLPNGQINTPLLSRACQNNPDFYLTSI